MTRPTAAPPSWWVKYTETETGCYEPAQACLLQVESQKQLTPESAVRSLCSTLVACYFGAILAGRG